MLSEAGRGILTGFFDEARRLSMLAVVRLLAALPDISQLIEVESDDPRLQGDWRDFLNPNWREQHPDKPELAS